MCATLKLACESGGIGRRTRLRIWRVTPVGVRVPPFAPSSVSSCQCPVSSLELTTQNLKTENSHMAQIPQQPEVKLTATKDYRDSYANSVQVRVNVWDFYLVFGTLKQQTPAEVEVENFQGVYISPQQAKALLAILGQNVAQYEQAFGEIKLDPKMAAVGPIH